MTPKQEMRSLTPDERELYDMLKKAGWPHHQAFPEAKTALANAELEAGYDGP